MSLFYTFNVAAVVCLSFTLLMLQLILSLLYAFNVVAVVCLSFTLLMLQLLYVSHVHV
jgi:hypothetical protein